MLCKNIRIDDTEILRDGIFWTTRNWTDIAVTDESRDIAGMHGRIVSPTYARYRTVTLEGVIDRRISDLPAIEHLQRIFRLQRHIEAVDAKILTVTDEYDRDWDLRVKVKEPLSFADADENFSGEVYKWRVVLESVGTPEMSSRHALRVPSTGYGEEGLYGGVKFGTKFGSRWNYSVPSVTVSSSSNTDIPLKITIECVDSGNPAGRGAQGPIVVQNATTGSRFIVNVSLEVGDKLVIDGNKLRVYKNENDVTVQRLPGSVFPSVFGQTAFIVTDQDWRAFSNDVRVYAEFFPTFL